MECNYLFKKNNNNNTQPLFVMHLCTHKKLIRNPVTCIYSTWPVNQRFLAPLPWLWKRFSSFTWGRNQDGVESRLQPCLHTKEGVFVCVSVHPLHNISRNLHLKYVTLRWITWSAGLGYLTKKKYQLSPKDRNSVYYRVSVCQICPE